MAPTADFIRNNPKLVKRAIWLAGILGGLQTADPIIASLALPKAGKGLQMDAATLALAASISTLCLAATVVLMGALADRIGRRRMMSILTVGLIAGDVIVFLAPQTAVFMLGRAIAGICAGGVIATAYAYVRTVSPQEKLGASLGLWGAICVGLALPLTVIASGLASIDWRFAFLCVPIVAAICLPLEFKVFPAMAPTPVKKQLYGVSLAGLGVAAILYGVSQTAKSLFSVSSVGPIVIGLFLIVLAGIVGLKSSRPAFPVRIFRSPVFITAAIAGALWNLSTAVAQLQSSNLWQYVHGLEPFTVSLLQLPVTLALIIGSLVCGRLLVKGMKPRGIIAIGFLGIAVGFVLMSVTGGSPVTIAFNIALVVVGFGAGAASVAQSQILITEATPEFVGSVAASRTTFGQIGYAIGLAGSSAITTILAIQAMGTPDARQQLNTFLTSDKQDVANNPALEKIASMYTDGFKSGMFIWAGLLVLGAIVCYLLMRMRPHPLVSTEPQLADGTPAA